MNGQLKLRDNEQLQAGNNRRRSVCHNRWIGATVLSRKTSQENPPPPIRTVSARPVSDDHEQSASSAVGQAQPIKRDLTEFFLRRSSQSGAGVNDL